jgi:hypothetical protein
MKIGVISTSQAAQSGPLPGATLAARMGAAAEAFTRSAELLVAQVAECARHAGVLADLGRLIASESGTGQTSPDALPEWARQEIDTLRAEFARMADERDQALAALAQADGPW